MGIFVSKNKNATDENKRKPAQEKAFTKAVVQQLSLSERQTQILYDTWTTYIRKNTSTVGTNMFIKLFERNDHIQKAFSQFRMLDKDMDMRSNASLESHALLVMNSMDETIDLLDQDLGTITRLLYRAGRSHRRFPSLLKEFFPAVEEPFLLAVKEIMGKRYTPEVEVIYTKFIKYVLGVVAEGFVTHQ